MVTQIEQMLVEAWGKFCDYYDTKAPQYRQNWRPEIKLKEKQAKKLYKKLYWICWNESDLMVHLGRYFYDRRRIESVSNEEFINIEMHFDKNLNYANFNGYRFEDKLWRANEDCYRLLEKELKSSKFPHNFPKLDLIIAREDSVKPFLLCAEAKCFHSSARNGTVEEEIEKDIITLASIKKLEITEKIAYIIFDDYYYNKRNPKDLKKISDDYAEKYNIKDELKILHHTSEAKLGKA